MITETPARTEAKLWDPTPEQVLMIAAEFIDDNPAGDITVEDVHEHLRAKGIPSVEQYTDMIKMMIDTVAGGY